VDAEEIVRRARAIKSDDERRAYLAEVCAEDVQLRAEAEFLLSLPGHERSEVGTTDLTPPLPEKKSMRSRRPTAGLGPGDVVDRYKLLQLIGEGGFGQVYMAEQREPVQRRVALKILKLGMDTRQVIARFEAERQALARMDHPNIARVLDAGSTPSGRPYFVMELVKGIPLLEYCELERIGTEQRLQLFREVCMAIQHAHQKGIIHRDIKPSNVLVTLHDGRPVPKVIDFGIAKATSGTLTDKTLFTEFRHMIGTPAYMSPEQAEMSGLDVDTRSDIYSLGVLLYELLTGTTPFDVRDLRAVGLSEMLRILREVEPERPSTRWSTQIRMSSAKRAADQAELARIGRMLRGDLDWIVMKCLEKDRQRRYDSASDLAADVLRYLRDEPVLASPPTTAYRMRKFVKRNRGRVIASAALIATLVVGAVGTTLGLVSVERERRATQRELVRASEVKQLVSDMLTSVRPEVAQGLDNQLMRKILMATEERLERYPVGDKEIEAELRQLIGVTYRHLALLEPAERELRKSVEVWQSAAGPEHRGTLDAMNSLAVLHATQGRSAEAESLYRAVIETARGSLGSEHEFTLAVLNNLGSLLLARGRVEEAGEIFEDSYALLRERFGEEHQRTVSAKSLLGGVRELEADFA
jgi:eukaryotic-like serine/threonine-protein kinase